MCTPTHRHTTVGQTAKTYIYQLCLDTGYSLGMDGERERERESRESMLSVCLKDEDDDHDEYVKIYYLILMLIHEKN